MSIEVGSAFVTIIPSLKGASSAIQRELGRSGIGTAVERNLTSGATRAGSRAGGLFSRAFSRSTRNVNLPGPSASLLRNLRTYGYAIAGIGSLTVGFGLKTESAFEQSKIAFTTILGSAKQAKALFKDLVTFAKKTPFDLPGVVSSTQKLLAFGFSAKKIKPDLTALGDAAAGLSLGTEGLDRLTTALGQIKAKGRLQSDELLQLTEAGVPALRILANQFGVTQAQLQDMVQKGLVPANKAIPALLKGLETGTKGAAGRTAGFAGLMKKQAHTLGGVFSNLKDTLSVGLARAVRPLVPVLKREIPNASKTLSRGLKAAGRDMAEFLHGLGIAKDRSKGATTGFEQFGSAVRGMFNAVRGTFRFIGAHAKLFKTLAVLVIGAVAALKTFRAVMIGVNLVLDANPISLIVLAIGAFAAGLVLAYKKSETFRDIVKGVFHVVERAVGLAVFAIVKEWKFAFDVIMSVIGGIAHAAASAFGWVPGVGGKLKGAARAFDGFKSHVDGVFDSIANKAYRLGQDVTNSVILGVQAGYAAAAKFYIKGSGLKGTLAKALGQQTKNTGSAIPQTLSSGIDTGSAKVSKSMSSLVDKILGPLKSLLQKAKQLAQSVTQSILGETGFGALLNQTDAFGQTSFGTSVKSIISGFAAQQRDVRQFRKELRLLDKRGLSAGAIEDIANLGLAQGGSLAQTLLGASRKQLRKISNLRGGVNAGARGIGTDVAGAKLGGEITRELVRTRHAIDNARQGTELGPKTMRKLTGGFAKEKKSAKVYLNTGQLDRHNGDVVASLL